MMELSWAGWDFIDHGSSQEFCHRRVVERLSRQTNTLVPLTSYPLDNGALPGWNSIRGRMSHSCASWLSQDRHSGPHATWAPLFGHLVITAVKELLALSQSLLKESRVTPRPSKSRPSSKTWSSWELGLQLLLLHSLNLLRWGHCNSVFFLISLTHFSLSLLHRNRLGLLHAGYLSLSLL